MEATLSCFPPGSLVKACNLTEKASLNGICGITNGKIQNERVGVIFPASAFPAKEGEQSRKSKAVALRPEQLLLLREAGEDADMPQRFPAPELVLPQSAPRRRILAYGDSLTAGYWDSGDRFTPYGASLVKRLLPDVVADIYVCGLSSLTAEEMASMKNSSKITDGVDRIGVGINHALKVCGPFDLALIMAGTNDLGSGADLNEIIDNITILHKMCHEQGLSTVALSVPPLRLLKNPKVRRRWQKLNDLIRERAESDGNPGGIVLFVDTEQLVPYSDESGKWEKDGLHFAQAGSIQLGNGLRDLLAPLLTSPQRIFKNI